MVMPVWNGTAAYEVAGDIVTLASPEVTVVKASDGSAVTIYTDRTGLNSVLQPLIGTSEGGITFYVEPGVYRITASKGGDSIVWDHVEIGAYEELDRHKAATNPHGVTAADVGAPTEAEYDAHVADTANPHGVTAAQAGAPTTAAFNAHTGDTANPHVVTKAQVGLGNVTDDAQLKAASDLADLASAPAARTNLSVYSQAEVNALQAAAVPVGGLVSVFDDVVGAADPDNSGTIKWVKLTAGEDGVGQYNEGLVSGESVSGVTPTIVATAAISHAASPMDGQTIRLINTEERFLRAGNSGVVQDSQNDAHNHGGSTGNAGSHSHGTNISRNTGTEIGHAGNNVGQALGEIDTTSVGNHSHGISSDGGSEARPRNVGITYFMRIA